MLTGGTLTPWDWGEGHAFRSLLGSLTDGRTRRVAFIVPAGLTWPLPLYELALLTSAYLRKRAIRGVSLQLISAEPAPLGVFGPAASRAVAGLLEQRDIVLTIGQETRAVEDPRANGRGSNIRGRRDRRAATDPGAAAAWRLRRRRRLHHRRSLLPNTGWRRCLPRPATAPISRSSREASPHNEPTPPRPESPSSQAHRSLPRPSGRSLKLCS